MSSAKQTVTLYRRYTIQNVHIHKLFPIVFKRFLEKTLIFWRNYPFFKETTHSNEENRQSYGENLNIDEENKLSHEENLNIVEENR